MGTANWWIGEVSHKDDRDGFMYGLAFPADLSPELQEKVLAIGAEEGTEVTFAVSRADWERLLSNISTHNDISDFGKGDLAELSEPYKVGTVR